MYHLRYSANTTTPAPNNDPCYVYFYALSSHLTNVRTAFADGDRALAGPHASGRLKVGAVLAGGAATAQSN